jgi:glutamate racemase
MTKLDTMQEKPLIGIFDSGVGGFSVYRKVRAVTSSDCIYYGDCARAPYGNREEEEIVQFIKDDIRFLQDENVTHFVNACNSMSVMTTDLILKECHIDPSRYTDMIRSFSKHAVFIPSEKVLVMATFATLRSHVYQEFLVSLGVLVFEYGFKDLAQAIENNASQEEILPMLMDCILYAKEQGVTKIIYGCTHYPLVHDYFMLAKERVMWEGEFIDPAVYVAMEVKGWGLTGDRKFIPYSSKDTPAFIRSVVNLF